MSGITFTKDMRVLDQLRRNVPAKLEQFGRAVAEEIVSDIKLSYGTSPPGRTHTRGKRSHVASQPGYPPNIDMGALRASIRWEAAGKLRWNVTDGVEYGYWLEVGTERMAARPHFKPIFEKWIQGDLARFGKEWGIL